MTAAPYRATPRGSDLKSSMTTRIDAPTTALVDQLRCCDWTSSEDVAPLDARYAVGRWSLTRRRSSRAPIASSCMCGSPHTPTGELPAMALVDRDIARRLDGARSPVGAMPAAEFARRRRTWACRGDSRRRRRLVSPFQSFACRPPRKGGAGRIVISRIWVFFVLVGFGAALVPGGGRCGLSLRACWPRCSTRQRPVSTSRSVWSGVMSLWLG